MRRAPPAFPSPAPGYDPANEAQFRAAVERTLVDASSGFESAIFDVREYGSIQAAIDAAAAVGGGRVHLVRGSYEVDQIRMKTGVALIGDGWGTRITQTAGATDGVDPLHLIVLDDVNVERITVRSLRLNGNKANQTTANNGIHLENTGGSWTTNDQHHLVRDVMIDSCKGSGVSLGGSVREARLLNVHAVRCDVDGFVTPPLGGTDNWLVNCTAEACGLWGFDALGYNNRYIGCKAFGNGLLGALGNRGGFWVTGHKVTLTGCQAEENTGRGFHFQNCDEPIGAGLNANANSEEGFLFDNMQRGNIQGVALSEPTLAHQQVWGFLFALGNADPSADNVIIMSGDPSEHAFGFLWDTADNKRNEIIIGTGYTRGSRWGVPGVAFRRHFEYGREGSPSTGNPDYFIQTGPENPNPISYFTSFDGSTSHTYVRHDHANARLLLGSVADVDVQLQGNLGFYNSPPIAKPTITGSRGANVALANLLAALGNLGLIVDNTTA